MRTFFLIFYTSLNKPERGTFSLQTTLQNVNTFEFFVYTYFLPFLFFRVTAKCISIRLSDRLSVYTIFFFFLIAIGVHTITERYSLILNRSLLRRSSRKLVARNGRRLLHVHLIRLLAVYPSNQKYLHYNE